MGVEKNLLLFFVVENDVFFIRSTSFCFCVGIQSGLDFVCVVEIDLVSVQAIRSYLISAQGSKSTLFWSGVPKIELIKGRGSRPR